MVEFCIACKSSLPKGDVTVVAGKVFTSHDYICPFCSVPANPGPVKPRDPPEPTDQKDVLIRRGAVSAVDPEAGGTP